MRVRTDSPLHNGFLAHYKHSLYGYIPPQVFTMCGPMVRSVRQWNRVCARRRACSVVIAEDEVAESVICDAGYVFVG